MSFSSFDTWEDHKVSGRTRREKKGRYRMPKPYALGRYLRFEYEVFYSDRHSVKVPKDEYAKVSSAAYIKARNRRKRVRRAERVPHKRAYGCTYYGTKRTEAEINAMWEVPNETKPRVLEDAPIRDGSHTTTYCRYRHKVRRSDLWHAWLLPNIKI